MGHGQVDELLVVRVFADGGGSGSCRFDLGVLVELRHNVNWRELTERKAWDDVWVAEHAFDLVPHGDGGNPADGFGLHQLAQGNGGRVFEDKEVQDDVGVQDCLGLAAPFARGQMNGVRAQFRQPFCPPEPWLS